jgi:hypothetical protein
VQKFLSLIKRRADITPEAFRDYYETQHAPLAMRLIGEYFIDYRRNYPQGVSALEASDPQTEALGVYDCVTEIWLEDGGFERLQAMLQDKPEIAAAIEADERKFMDRTQVRLMLCDEIRHGA